MQLDSYQAKGYDVVKGAIPKKDIFAVRAAITDLIRTEAERAGSAVARDIAMMDDTQVPHDGLLALREADREHMRRTVDRIKMSPAFLQTVCRSGLQDIAWRYVGAERPEHVGLAHLNVRVDLPSTYSEDKRMFSLPWHQESGYYKAQMSPETSIVLWIPLYDCGKEGGCLEVLETSHLAGSVQHRGFYIDEVNKKHYRVEVPEEHRGGYESVFGEARACDLGILHFNTIHRSGINETDGIRYTLLVRASNMFCPGFII